MTAISFLEALAAKRLEYLNALAIVPDGETNRHIRIKGQIQGLSDAEALFKANMKSDDERDS